MDIPGCCRQFPRLASLVEYLGTLSGRADLKVLERLLMEASVTRAEIEAAVTFGQKGYRRNTIAKTEWFELLALCWRSGHCTPIHDHQGVSCSFRVVEGHGTEIRFTKTPSGMLCPAAINDMPPGYLCSADDADIHQIANMQAPGKDLITLHIYSPPISHMNVYQMATPCTAEAGAVY